MIVIIIMMAMFRNTTLLNARKIADTFYPDTNVRTSAELKRIKRSCSQNIQQIHATHFCSINHVVFLLLPLPRIYICLYVCIFVALHVQTEMLSSAIICAMFVCCTRINLTLVLTYYYHLYCWCIAHFGWRSRNRLVWPVFRSSQWFCDDNNYCTCYYSVVNHYS